MSVVPLVVLDREASFPGKVSFCYHDLSNKLIRLRY